MNQESFIISIDGKELSSFQSDLLSMDVALRYDEASHFCIKLSIDSNSDGSWPALDDSPFGLWKKIEISAGFNSTLDKLFTGYITHIRPVFGFNHGTCSLEISGYDETVLLDREEKVKVWTDTSDSSIVSNIFALYGFTTEVEDTKITHNEAVSSIVQRETDIQFLKRLAARNGYECYVINSKAFFGKAKLREISQPALSVQFGSKTDVNYFVLDLNGLNPVTAFTSQLGRLTKTIIDENGTSDDIPKLGSQPFGKMVSNGITPAKLLLSHNPATGQQEMSELTKSVASSAGWLISGEGQIAGNLYGYILRPWKPVTIKGIGDLYSGTYYVTDVTHRFTKTGYFQNFKVVRNGTGLLGDETF